MNLQILQLHVKRYRQVIVDIPEAQFGIGSHVLAGANGSGKSTLLQALAGLLPYQGKIFLNDSQHKPLLNHQVGYLPQDPVGLEHLTVIEAVQYAQQVTKVPASAEHWVATVAMEDRTTRRIGKLSGGERRLAYLAMVLAQETPIIVLDEPTAGLDAQHRIALRSAILAATQDRIILTASHNADDLESLGQHVIVLKNGRVCFDGTGPELLSETKTGNWDTALMALETHE